MKSTKNQAMRNLILELVMANMAGMRKHLKVTGELDQQRYQLLFSLFLELAPDDAISEVARAFEEKGLMNFDKFTFDA